MVSLFTTFMAARRTTTLKVVRPEQTTCMAFVRQIGEWCWAEMVTSLRLSLATPICSMHSGNKAISRESICRPVSRYTSSTAGARRPLERFNWDSPILVSEHESKRLYFASQRVWRSDDRGDSWTAISDDLTRDQDRMLLPLMSQTWSWDASWDMSAMSDYNTITSLAESPFDERVLYAGTDDGLIQVTENGGGSGSALRWEIYLAFRTPRS